MHNFARESRMIQNQLVALYAKRRVSDAERAKRGLTPLPRPASPVAALVRPVALPALSPATVPARVAPLTAADLEYERVRAAAIARHATERAEAAEVDKAVASILDARDIAAGRVSAGPSDPNVSAILEAVRLASAL